jgi:diketogulonate reductase-like aldo/keto reductase
VAAAWAGVEALLEAQRARAAGVAHAGWRGLDALLGACRAKPLVNAAELHPLLSQARSGQPLPARRACGCACSPLLRGPRHACAR